VLSGSISFLSSALSSPHPSDIMLLCLIFFLSSALPKPYTSYSALSDPISFLPECTFELAFLTLLEGLAIS